MNTQLEKEIFIAKFYHYKYLYHYSSLGLDEYWRTTEVARVSFKLNELVIQLKNNKHIGIYDIINTSIYSNGNGLTLKITFPMGVCIYQLRD